MRVGRGFNKLKVFDVSLNFAVQKEFTEKPLTVTLDPDATSSAAAPTNTARSGRTSVTLSCRDRTPASFQTSM